MTAQSVAVLPSAPEQLPGARVLDGVPPRLVVGSGVCSSTEERTRGYLAGADTERIIAELEAAGLRGRGGAGFPTHVKWCVVQAAHVAGEPTVVVANGHEGEPASVKDRWLLLHRPFLVLDGLLLAARAVGAYRAIVYVSRDDTAAAARGAVAELRAAGSVPEGLSLEVFQVSGGYVAGEESAVCRALNGGPALPTAKPPRPFERGVDDRPTLVDNVETLAHAAWIAAHGSARFRSVGTASSPGTALFTLNAAAGAGRVVEAPLGSTVGDLFAAAGLDLVGSDRLLMGGWFGGVVRTPVPDLVCCYDAVRAAGSGLGCASITALREADVVPGVAELAAWYARESSRQCGVCKNGTQAISQTLHKVVAGETDPEDLEKLTRWGATLSGRGACAFLDGAATLARTAAVELTAAAPTSGPEPALK